MSSPLKFLTEVSVGISFSFPWISSLNEMPGKINTRSCRGATKARQELIASFKIWNPRTSYKHHELNCLILLELAIAIEACPTRLLRTIFHREWIFSDGDSARRISEMNRTNITISPRLSSPFPHPQTWSRGWWGLPLTPCHPAPERLQVEKKQKFCLLLTSLILIGWWNNSLQFCYQLINWPLQQSLIK